MQSDLLYSQNAVFYTTVDLSLSLVGNKTNNKVSSQQTKHIPEYLTSHYRIVISVREKKDPWLQTVKSRIRYVPPLPFCTLL